MTDVRQTILIADDDPVNLKQLYQALRGEYRVLFAKDGIEAVDLTAQNLPDLLILDIVMPGLDGYAVLKAVKSNQDTKDIPVVFVSSKGEVVDETQGLELGAVDYWIKPLSNEIVRARARIQLELTRHRKELAALAEIDGLTNILNRRGFDRALDREWRRCARSGAPLSTVIIDVDNFKQYNDVYGHTAGDDCLRTIGEILSVTLKRPADVAARHGGEEFACILPETDGEGARFIAEEIRAAIEQAGLEHIKNDPYNCITASLGVASIKPGDDVVPGDLLKNADEALYRSKASGRNRVTVWS